MRIGLGYDAHRLVSGRKLILGGVSVPFHRGLAGHSDADVLTHAICDALLGAAALGDLGAHFPDTDERYKEIESLKLLSHVGELITKEGYRIGNIDATVLAEQPKLIGHIPRMVQKIADCLGITPLRIGIKATTTEGMGFPGRGEGIAALATVLIQRAHFNDTEQTDT